MVHEQDQAPLFRTMSSHCCTVISIEARKGEEDQQFNRPLQMTNIHHFKRGNMLKPQYHMNCTL